MPTYMRTTTATTGDVKRAARFPNRPAAEKFICESPYHPLVVRNPSAVAGFVVELLSRTTTKPEETQTMTGVRLDPPLQSRLDAFQKQALRDLRAAALAVKDGHDLIAIHLALDAICSLTALESERRASRGEDAIVTEDAPMGGWNRREAQDVNATAAGLLNRLAGSRHLISTYRERGEKPDTR